jgi:hypothetical protein
MSRPDADILGKLAGDQHATWQNALHRCAGHSHDQVDQEFRR